MHSEKKKKSKIVSHMSNFPSSQNIVTHISQISEKRNLSMYSMDEFKFCYLT